VAAARALVTGAAGFVGQWLVRALVEDGYDVTGAALHAPASAPPDVRWITGDVRDAEHLAHAVDAARPDAVFHLAGVTFVPDAANDPGATAEINAVAAMRLLGVIRQRRRAGALDPVVVVVGSAEQYGRHDESELPLVETAEQRPHTVYAATKVAQEAMALEAWRSDGVRVICTRSFNHSGPGQNSRLLLPALVSRALALRDRPGPMLVGNQTTVRDFLHVSDVVRAYIQLAARGSAGEAYNVASGEGHSVGSLTRHVLARVGVDAPVESDPALVRAADVPALVGDASKLRAATGWTRERSLDDILDDLIHAATH
jgi:GDP-4-dehydro-6-deoxy-D-mannose reductase